MHGLSRQHPWKCSIGLSHDSRLNSRRCCLNGSAAHLEIAEPTRPFHSTGCRLTSDSAAWRVNSIALLLFQSSRGLGLWNRGSIVYLSLNFTLFGPMIFSKQAVRCLCIAAIIEIRSYFPCPCQNISAYELRGSRERWKYWLNNDIT